MVELYDGLMTTRSMRWFSDDPVTDEEIERILEVLPRLVEKLRGLTRPAAVVRGR